MSVELLDQLARERAGMPPEWQVYHYESIGPPGPKRVCMKLIGSVPSPFRSGKRKGGPNYKANPETVREVWITDAENEAYCKAWEEKTGKCSHCMGSGQVVAGWSQSEGQRMKPCRDCVGTGKSRESSTVPA